MNPAPRRWLTPADHTLNETLAALIDNPDVRNLAIAEAHRHGDDLTVDNVLAAIVRMRDRVNANADDDLVARAAHEAGHTVVAVAMGMDVLSVDIADDTDHESGGQTTSHLPDHTVERLWAALVVTMGGSVGERTLTGQANPFAALADMAEATATAAALVLLQWGTGVSELITAARERAGALVAMNGPQVAAVQAALLERGELGALDVIRLTAGVRSVALSQVA